MRYTCFLNILTKDDDDVPKMMMMSQERRWVLLKRPRCDIDGVGEGK